MDMWKTLEAQTCAWNALDRQGLADAIWEDFVSVRFGRTGDTRALEYLYPYLNRADRWTRLRAIEVAACVFEGRGPRALGPLDYFTKNPDPFLRDRAVQVVGAAVRGLREGIVLEVLEPYLNHPNRFVRRLALVELGRAAAGRASARVLAEIRRVAQASGSPEREVDLAIATAFAGRPTEEVYGLVARPELADRIGTGNQKAVAVLVRGAPDAWYERAYEEVFRPRLHAGDAAGWRAQFIRRDGITALIHASPGRGMGPLERMLHLRNSRCTGHALFCHAPICLAGADVGANREPLLALVRSGDVQAQRIAAVCLGRLVMGAEDGGAIEALRELCGARTLAVLAAALAGLGMAARSTCDEALRQLCLDRALNDETATSAIRALGTVFLGSGRADVFEEIRDRADFLRSRPVRGRKHCKPLAACYWATGMLYLGTGSMEPVDFLLDIFSARPASWAHDEYRWCAAKALVMVESSEAALGWTGCMEPFDFLLDVTAMPRLSWAYNEYRWVRQRP